MTTIYAKCPREKQIKELEVTTDKPKVALQKYITANSYVEAAKQIEATGSGYTYTMSNGHKVMAY